MATDYTADKPTLIMIRGLPGSGKSYLAHALRDALGHAAVTLLDPDATDYTSEAYKAMSEALSADGVDAKFHPYRFLRNQAYDAIVAHKVIIWNQAFTNLDGFNKTVVNLQTYATEHDTELPVLVVEVTVRPDTAKARVASRVAKGGHDVDEAAFARFINDYRSFEDEGYNIVAVSGEDEIATSVSTVLAAIKSV